MKEIIFRFLVGGSLVSVFAFIGDLLRPKSFAGLFGAAPSVALASLALTIATEGKVYAAMEARSILYGVVDSEMDKDVACIRANSVPGMFKATNDLKVAGSSEKNLRKSHH